MSDTETQAEPGASTQSVAGAAMIGHAAAIEIQIGLGLLKGITEQMHEESNEETQIDSNTVGVWAEQIDWFIDVFNDQAAVVRQECKRAGVPNMKSSMK